MNFKVLDWEKNNKSFYRDIEYTKDSIKERRTVCEIVESKYTMRRNKTDQKYICFMDFKVLDMYYFEAMTVEEAKLKAEIILKELGADFSFRGGL